MPDPCEIVRNWVERMVVGQGLCPFAARPLAAGQVRFACCAEEGADAIYRGFLGEVQRLLENPADAIETTLYVVPAGLGDFNAYLDMLANLEEALVQAGLEGQLQIASFHPDYLFAGAPDEDPANWSNRSPLPVFHLIREEQLGRALARVEDPSAIPARNVEYLRAMGLDRIREILDGPVND